MATRYPQTFVDLNNISTKELNVVVEIEGSAIMFSLVETSKKIRYGDPGLTYGEPGLVYGGLAPIGNIKPILSPNSNLTISQKIEPEQGRGNAGTLSLEFVDLEGFMSNFVSPGQVLDEVLGGKQIKVYLGFANSSFKEDYFVIFRGYITMTTCAPTKVILQVTDANIKRKQQVFFTTKTAVSTRILHFTVFNPGTNSVDFPGHGYQLNNIIQFSTTGSLPSGVSSGTNYYIVNPSPDHYQFSTTPSGSPVTFPNTGTGVQTSTLIETGTDATTIFVDDPLGFVQPILGPNGGYDSTLTTYAKISDEFMIYGPTGSIFSDHIVVTRAQRGSLAASHKPGDSVENLFQLQGNIIDLALKVMLAGFGAPWITGQTIAAFNVTGDPGLGTIPNCIVLPNGVDAVDDYGLSVGDYLYVTGSTSNNGTYTISSFADANGFPNILIIVNQTTVNESPTSGVFASRSQYDTLPASVSSGLRPVDVDVAGWNDIKNNFAFQPDCTFSFLISQPESGKDWIEQNLLLPGGLYGITRFGRISCSATKPPLAGDNLVILDNTNVVNPQNITVTRGLNNRRFFNEVQYKYDYDNAGNETNVVAIIDTTSLNKFDTSSVLPISGLGIRTALGADTFIQRRGGFIIRRYSNAAYEIAIDVNFMAAALVEVSDTVAVYDNGNLQIVNFATGQRNLGSQLFEVIQRQLDIRTGQGKLTLLSQVGYQVTDKFAGIAPSSKVDTGATTTRIPIKESYGGKFLTQEWKKYQPIVGDQIRIHSEDYTFDHTVTLDGFDSGNPNILLVGSGLPSAPLADYVIDLAMYDASSPSVNQKSKLLFCFIDPTLTVVSGSSTTVFTVSSGDAAKLVVGLPVQIHSPDYSRNSSEANVLSVIGTTVTLATAIEFTPVAGDQVELVGFLDGGGAYRIL